MTITSPAARRARNRLAPLLGALLLAACGSSSPEPTVAVSGSVFAAPVAGATVSVQDAAGLAVAAPATTAADGTFTVLIPQSRLAVPLFLVSGGGTFTDEATGAATAAGALQAYAPAGSLSAGAAVHLTPASTMVAVMVGHGTAAAAASAAFQAAFGFAPDTAVAPANAPVAAGASAAPALAALRAGAFSQLAKDLGIPAAAQFDLFHELAHDALDGALDGTDGGAPLTVGAVTLPADVQNRFATALVTWRASGGNLTGLNAGQLGDLPFGKVALTASYRVEYRPGTMGAAVGRSPFRLAITDRVTGQPVTGAAVALMPVMRMPTMSHSTPVGPVVEAGAGVYDATAYYVMMSGPDMGYWELGVTVGGMDGERATFYPPVGMAMGSTAMARLTGGAGDQIAGMMGASARTYQLFNDRLALSGGAATFEVLVTTMDTMMSFPHVAPAATLHDGSGAAVTVQAVQVRVSSDDGASWATATDLGGGHYSAGDLAGLSAGVATALRVELSVDLGGGLVVKPTQDGSAAYATFTVTPAAMP